MESNYSRQGFVSFCDLKNTLYATKFCTMHMTETRFQICRNARSQLTTNCPRNETLASDHKRGTRIYVKEAGTQNKLK